MRDRKYLLAELASRADFGSEQYNQPVPSAFVTSLCSALLVARLEFRARPSTAFKETGLLLSHSGLGITILEIVGYIAGAVQKSSPWVHSASTPQLSP